MGIICDLFDDWSSDSGTLIINHHYIGIVMLKYTTILESKKFKVSKVKNTTTGKSWYSFIHSIDYSFTVVAQSEREQIIQYLGENYKLLNNGREWKFKYLEQAKKKYNWALMRWA